MDFALDEEQTELRGIVRSAITKQTDPDALWTTLCDQIGVAALMIPEEYDGAGASYFETSLVLEALGGALVHSPLLATTVATAALLGGGTEDAKARLLPRIAAGEIATVALEPGQPVLDADRATIVLAIEGDDLVEVAAPRTTWLESMDQTLRFASLAYDDRTPIGRGDAARRSADLVRTAAVASLAVGLTEQALAMTTDYAKTRVQFGRPIGSFQAVKHRLAEVLARLELARSATWAASYAVATDADDAARQVAGAASYAIETAGLAASECVQLHGGIAITWEHDAHLVFKRAHALSHLVGAGHRLRQAAVSG